MSYILRSTLRYSVRRSSINCVKQPHGFLVSQTSPHIGKLLSNSFLSFHRGRFPNLSMGNKIDKIDAEVRRNGRITLREVQDVHKELASTKCTSVSQWVKVIQWCGNLLSEELPEKRIQLVQDIWNTLEKRDERETLCISYYNALLKVYLENEHAILAEDILAELDKKFIRPNDITCRRLVTYYCEKGDIEGANRIFQLMRNKEIDIQEVLIDEVVYNALMLGHSIANDMASAEGILNVMRQNGIHPSGETYTILICGYIDQGDINKVRSLLEECKTNHIHLVYEDYFKIIYHLSRKGLDVDEILSKVGPNDAYHQEVINFVYKLVKMGKPENALKILKNMVRSTPREEELMDDNRQLRRVLSENWHEEVATLDASDREKFLNRIRGRKST